MHASANMSSVSRLVRDQQQSAVEALRAEGQPAALVDLDDLTFFGLLAHDNRDVGHLDLRSLMQAGQRFGSADALRRLRAEAALEAGA